MPKFNQIAELRCYWCLKVNKNHGFEWRNWL